MGLCCRSLSSGGCFSSSCSRGDRSEGASQARLFSTLQITRHKHPRRSTNCSLAMNAAASAISPWRTGQGRAGQGPLHSRRGTQDQGWQGGEEVFLYEHGRRFSQSGGRCLCQHTLEQSSPQQFGIGHFVPLWSVSVATPLRKMATKLMVGHRIRWKCIQVACLFVLHAHRQRPKDCATTTPHTITATVVAIAPPEASEPPGAPSDPP